MKSFKLLLVLLAIVCVTLITVSCDKEQAKDPVQTVNKTPITTINKTNTPAPTQASPTATPEKGVNVALDKDFEVSSETVNTNRGWTAICVNDGLIDAEDAVHMGWTSQVGKNPSEDANPSEWVIIDLGKEYNIHMVKAWPRQDDNEGGLYFPVDYQIDISNDKETWTKVYEKKDDNGAENFDKEPREMELENAKGRYVRFLGTKLTRINATYQDNGLLMQLAELEIFSYDTMN